MDTPENDQILLNNKNDNNEKTSYGIDEIIVFYHFGWGVMIFLIIHSLPIIFFFFDFFLTPFKKVIIIDEDKKTLIICDKAVFGCFKLNKKIYNLSQIRKVRIYVSSIPDPKVGFNKLYFINCDIFSIDGEQEALFSQIQYDKKKFNEFVNFFKKHLNTEVESLDDEKCNNITNEENNCAITINENSYEEEIITKKPTASESAPLPK